MRRLGLVLSAAVGAAALTACSAPGDPEVTFFADGTTINATASPCDLATRQCKPPSGGESTLKVRPGKPVQISVPSEVADSPWQVVVQYADAQGQPLPPVPSEAFFGGDRYAYTVTSPEAAGQLLVVEVQQAGPAYVEGKLLVDADGTPVLVPKNVWSLQVRPAEPYVPS